MNNVVDINDIKTYPKIFYDFCTENKECLLNSFHNLDDRLEAGSGLFEDINEMFNGINFECLHASRILDVESIKRNGLLNPSKYLDMSSIILNGIKDKISEEVYLPVYNELNNTIKNNDKYKTLHFVIGSISDITLSNGFLMLDNYGGELLEDIFCILKFEKIYKKIRFTGIPVAIIFKVPKEQLEDYFLSDIYNYIIKKVIFNSDKHFFRETWIYDSVPKENIIDVKELYDYE